jgi:hypothetical protein
MKGGFMHFTIGRHSRYVIVFAVVASSLALLGATGGVGRLAQLGYRN